jgi:translation initiation factor IF-3
MRWNEDGRLRLPVSQFAGGEHGKRPGGSTQRGDVLLQRVAGMRPRRKEDHREREVQTRINEMIRIPQVLLIDETGANKGIVNIADAQNYALEKSLDLVEISPQARPPVCRVMDFGKWKYEQNVKAKEARKHRSQVIVKEIKFRVKIGTGDYDTKKNHVRRFLDGGDKVKVTIMFRGREVVHSHLGREILNRVAADVADLGTVEQHPNLEGRNMTMVIGPLKKKEAKHHDAAPHGDDAAASTNGNGATPAPEAAEAAEAAPAVEETAAEETTAAEPAAAEPATASSETPAD